MQHDMEMRFENQDRMINYLLSQIQGLEGNSLQSLKKANELSEKDRELMQKRSMDLKIQFDNANLQLSDLQAKVNALTQE